MLYNTQLLKTVKVEAFYVISGYVDKPNGREVANQRCGQEPTVGKIAEFLANTGAEYAEVRKRYRLVGV